MNESVCIINFIFTNCFILMPIRVSPAERLSELGLFSLEKIRRQGNLQSSLSVPTEKVLKGLTRQPERDFTRACRDSRGIHFN